MILIIIQIGILNNGSKLNIDANINENSNEKNVSNIIENKLKEDYENISSNGFENSLEINSLNSSNLDELVWQLEIPKINLKADICEGTSQDILNQYIGHFEETSKCIGNVGLAAHNRGYNVNYFERLKELEPGDEIFYTYNGITKKYIVNLKTIIKDTQVEILENTKENILTLVTCVEGEPEYRRCIQAIIKE